MDAAALRALVRTLRETLAVRERQLERKGGEAAEMAAVTAALQRKNEELAQSRDGEAVAEIQRCGQEGRVAAGRSAGVVGCCAPAMPS